MSLSQSDQSSGSESIEKQEGSKTNDESQSLASGLMKAVKGTTKTTQKTAFIESDSEADNKMMAYINGVLEEHYGPQDEAQINQIFSNFALKDQKLDKQRTQYAYEKVFDSWDIDLTKEQEQEFKAKRFESVWEQFTKDQNSIDKKDAV